MTRAPAEEVAETFVELADTLVADFDLVDLLHRLALRCVQLLDIGAAGLLLAGEHSQLRVVAASSESPALLALLESQHDEGPSVECHRTGEARVIDIDDAARHWPGFAAAARAAGFAAVQTLPMRQRQESIGVLNLFHRSSGPPDPASTRIAQAMADVTTIGLLHERTVREREELAAQLQAALDSRVLIEQAKGMLAERLQVDVEVAFATIRRFARRQNQLLAAVARAVVDGTADMAQLAHLALQMSSSQSR